MSPTLVAVVAVVVTLGLGGAFTRIGPWYRALAKPSWNPPDWLFAPAWFVILGLSAWAGVIAWAAAATPAERTRILALYVVNLVLNAAWSPLFFVARRPDLAMIEAALLWASVLALIVGLAPIASQAALLNVPYIAWVSFAFLLNRKIVLLNRAAAERATV